LLPFTAVPAPATSQQQQEQHTTTQPPTQLTSSTTHHGCKFYCRLKAVAAARPWQHLQLSNNLANGKGLLRDILKSELNSLDNPFLTNTIVSKVLHAKIVKHLC